MKKLLTSIFLLSSMSCFTFLNAQSIQTGIEFYEEGNYERALRIFENLNSPEANLFAGKSYFGLNNFIKAKYYLNQINETDSDVYNEAKYTEALTDFQLKNYPAALDAAFELNETILSSSLSRDVYKFYEQLIHFLSLEQRLEAFRESKYDKIRFDLMEYTMGKVDLSSARAILKAYKNSVMDQPSSQLRDIEQMVGDSVSYQQRYNPGQYAEAPEGMTYNIGVVLPQFDSNSPQYEISQHIYFGIQLAVENFNSENTDRKVFISYQNSESESESISGIVSELMWIHNTDAIIGPLFSEVAMELSEYAELYRIPMLTPLANSDEINLNRNYTFQLNPTFGMQGTRMAQYAIQNLGYDTLAVIAEKGSFGEPSAIAFRDEVRRLGGEVVRYIVDDFAVEGYDISEYVQYFDPEVDTLFNYNIDAVYAPFTGNIAETLINTLLTNIEAIGSDMTLLGSEEWESLNTRLNQLTDNPVYYTKTRSSDLNSQPAEEFKNAFRLRFETAPNEFAFIGYDAASVILETLLNVQNPIYLREGLKEIRNYSGLSMEISFEGQHINQEVGVYRIQN
jgi:ABC-type branched-subunit amino acid transport system substrate-binding protein